MGKAQGCKKRPSVFFVDLYIHRWFGEIYCVAVPSSLHTIGATETSAVSVASATGYAAAADV